MRILHWVLPLPLVLAAVVFAQQKQKTEAQMDGFTGPVRSVSTRVVMARVKWQQPAGPSLITPVFCRECEYTPDGYRASAGQITDNGEFVGEKVEFVRNGQGHVVERTFANAHESAMSRQERFGPHGQVE